MPVAIHGHVVPPSASSPFALDSATVNGATVKVTFSTLVDEDSIPAKGSFAVSLGGTVQTPTRVAVDGRTLTLTLATAATADQAVLLTYTRPGEKRLRTSSSAS